MSAEALQIAAAILDSHASAYAVTDPTQHTARAKVIASAARAIEPMIAAMLTAHAESCCAANPS